MKPGLILILGLIVLTSIFDTISQLFLKFSINSLNFNIDGIKKIIKFIIKLIMVPWVWVGFLFSTLSLITWLFVLSKADLNFAFSVDSMHYIFIAVASKLILKEKIGGKRWIGTILIVMGIAIVAIS